MELVEFLIARIDEDEAAAREASVMPYGDQIGWVGHVFSSERDSTRAQDAHITRWDPARVLAECESKRRIVERYRKTMAAQEANTDEHTRASSRVDRHGELPLLRRDGWVYEGRLWGLKVALTFLALPYRDHPDYDRAWNPEATQ